MRRRLLPVLFACAALAACGGESSESASPATEPPAVADGAADPSAAVVTDPAETGADTTPVDTSTPDTQAPADPNGIVNVWSGAVVDPTALPIGDDGDSTTTPGVGIAYSCVAGNANAPGASSDGPWIDSATNTWDSTTKLAVEGEVSWPTATYDATVEGEHRHVTSNGLPVEHPTGEYPIAEDDPAYAYDRNPGVVQEVAYDFELPVNPAVADDPSCLGLSRVGILTNGVVLFNALDARGDDAPAHEVTDLCDGHPSPETYHYHSIPSCILEQATGASTVVGWAMDGFPIVVERDAAGNLPTNADLDECHGRTSPILLDGVVVETYHYSATLEFPYTLGCYRGTPVV